MKTKVIVRIKRGQSQNRVRVASRMLERSGYQRRTVRRDGHPVTVWVL
ncbi:hypothetical protein [Sphingomonas sp. GV3]|jgi:hypothetical protein|nr:hypothetical protein [Sphingomonas sp. GV3]